MLWGEEGEEEEKLGEDKDEDKTSEPKDADRFKFGENAEIKLLRKFWPIWKVISTSLLKKEKEEVYQILNFGKILFFTVDCYRHTSKY